jgi:hypothetical protein
MSSAEEILHDGNGNSWHAVCDHEGRGGFFDLRALVSGKAFRLCVKRRCGKRKNR